MRKRSGVILAVIGYIVFFFCMEGRGADLKFIHQGVEGSVWIDVASISRQPNNIVGAWLKITYSEMGVTDWVKKWGKNTKIFLIPCS